MTSIISVEKDIVIDEAAYIENYKDIPEPSNAEPNWEDTLATTSENDKNSTDNGFALISPDKYFMFTQSTKT